MISIQDLNKTYIHHNKPNQVLCGINLEINRGEIFGIIGRSGAGKSTLIRCMNLLEVPTSGRVIVDGNDLTEQSTTALRKLRRKIGMIFQHFNLLSSCNIYENIAFPLRLQHLSKPSIESKVQELLNIIGLANKAHAYPDQLSGGEKQRVAIARAIASDPIALLSDEATSALDPETTEQILQLLQQLNERLGITIVLITHEMHVIRKICHKVAIIEHGLIQERNTVTGLFLNPKTTLARKFVDNSMHLQLSQEIKQKLFEKPDDSSSDLSPVIKLTFSDNVVTRPVISTLNARFGVLCNILQAHIERIQSQSVGITICHIQGDQTSCKNALAYLQQQQIKLEIIGYAAADAF